MTEHQNKYPLPVSEEYVPGEDEGLEYEHLTEYERHRKEVEALE